MGIDSDHMGVLDDAEFAAVISTQSAEYRRIFTDLYVIGDSVAICAEK